MTERASRPPLPGDRENRGRRLSLGVVGGHPGRCCRTRLVRPGAGSGVVLGQVRSDRCPVIFCSTGSGQPVSFSSRIRVWRSWWRVQLVVVDTSEARGRTGGPGRWQGPGPRWRPGCSWSVHTPSVRSATYHKPSRRCGGRQRQPVRVLEGTDNNLWEAFYDGRWNGPLNLNMAPSAEDKQAASCVGVPTARSRPVPRRGG